MKQFDQNKTADQAFSLASGKTIPVRMMVRNDRNAFFRYGETDQVQILEMPYVNGTGTPLSMFILLPRENNLDRLERSLDARKFSDLKKSLSNQLVMVDIPKFRLETRYDLSRNLAAMSMPDAFSASADLSGMDGTQDLMIDRITHNAYIDVN